MDQSIDIIVKTLIEHMHPDEMISFYLKSPLITNALNDPEVLRLLSVKYLVPLSYTFPDFINFYDEKYVTLRCLNKYTSKECLLRAILAGNLETIEELWGTHLSSHTRYEAINMAAENNKTEALIFLLNSNHLSLPVITREIIASRIIKKGYLDAAFILVPNPSPQILKDWISKLAFFGYTDNVIRLVGNEKHLISVAASSAAEGGHYKLTKILIKKGADHRKLYPNALESGNEKLINYIISLGD